jgi:hypothetical protein
VERWQRRADSASSPKSKTSDIKAATDAQDALKAGIADINNKEISNVQKDIEIKALQAKSPAPVATASWGSNIKDRLDRV